MSEIHVMTPGAEERIHSVWSDLAALTKPRLNLLVLVAIAAGFYLGTPATAPHTVQMNWSAFAAVLIGALLVASGSSALNQFREQDIDKQMHRTRDRPLPMGRMNSRMGLTLGITFALIGAAVLATWTNALATSLSLCSLVLYVFLYTPLKRSTTLNTIVGAVPGAIPPLIGWAAANNPEGFWSFSLALPAWTLFGIVFLWQMPHFLAIAWMYRVDYARAGFAMLPVQDTDGRSTGFQALIYAAALVPISLSPTLFHLTGKSYALGAAFLSITFCVFAALFALKRTDRAARLLFLASIIYLPLLLALLVLDKAGWI